MEHLLCEHVGGFELFELRRFEGLSGVSFNDYMVLCQVADHVSSLSIDNSAEAVAQIRCLEQGSLHPALQNFLELNGVRTLHCDKSLKGALKQVSIEQKSSPNILRGIKLNLKRITKKAMNKQLVLGAASILSKESIKYDMEREDNVVVSTGDEIEHLEMDILDLQSKMSKLLDWIFPRFGQILKNDTESIGKLLGDQIDQIDLGKLPDSMRSLAKEILGDARKEDVENLRSTICLMIEKEKLLAELEDYLAEKMRMLAPNLRQILGDRLASKLIHKAGGLMNLSLYPSSTLQLLGAEKALFRSLKMKSQTPKYGLICQLDYLKENRGRMSRYIAAKCSLAARIDYFSKERTDEYGRGLRVLVENKIKSHRSRRPVETSADILKRVHDRLAHPGQLVRTADMEVLSSRDPSQVSVESKVPKDQKHLSGRKSTGHGSIKMNKSLKD